MQNKYSLILIYQEKVDLNKEYLANLYYLANIRLFL